MSAAATENRLRGIALRLAMIVVFSLMSVCIKLASERGVHLGELMFWRQAAALPVVLAWIAAGPGLASVRTARFSAHARRSAMGLCAMACTFGALTLLPLAEATIFSFTVPIFATLLAVVVLKEVVGWNRWAAVVAGFIGVLIVLQPGRASIPIGGAAVGLLGGLIVGITSIQIRALGRTEASTTTVFWFTVLSVPVLALALPFAFTPHDPTEWLLLGTIGTLGGIGQLFLTASLRFAPVSTVIVVDYSALIWSTLFGWLIWAQLPAPATWIGAPIIIASGLYIVWREHRLSIKRTQEIAA